jgi:2-polyprenyl-3-methyl-5-hydroxy-6-metoxy-1,4-benzoquinol methylase
VPDAEAEAWDAGSAAWIELIRDADAPMHAHDVAIRELLPAPGGPAVDAGCGEGRWTRELKELGYDVLGVDVSEALVEAARAADPGGRYAVAPVEELPVADGSVELVVCINVLQHVVDLAAAARELARVVRPGGAVVAGVTHPMAEAGRHDAERDELAVSGYFEPGRHPVPLGTQHVVHHHRTIEAYVRTFTGAGFVLDDLREIPGRTGSFPRYLDLRLVRR